MATAQFVTASNNPRVDHEQAGNVLDDWGFIGEEMGLSVEIADGHLTIAGYQDFSPYPEDAVDHPDDRYEVIDRQQFLEEIAPTLKDPLVVQSISHTKCRFPLGAIQFVAYPDGTVGSTAFNGNVD